MRIKLGVVMDPISSIDIKKDSTFAILLAAQKRMYKIYYMEMHSLYIKKEKAYADTFLITVKKKTTKWFKFLKRKKINLSNLNIILMRKDPPFNIEYIYSTYILEIAKKNGVLVINDPSSLRNYNEKVFLSYFPKITTNHLITRSQKKIKVFLRKQKDIIVKPLDKMGGESIFRLQLNDPNIASILEYMTNHDKKYCMAQKFIPEICKGDKRVLIIGKKIIPYCLNRKPNINDQNKGNLARGGKGKVEKLTKKDKKIAKHVLPVLKKKKLFIVGLDIIGNYLTEINITSPTCICQIEKKTNFSITSILLDCIEKNIRNR